LADKIGIVAGGGGFPPLLVAKAREHGAEVHVAALRGYADEGLREGGAAFAWVGIAQVGRIIRFFKRGGVKDVIFAGDVAKAEMYSPTKFLRHPPDMRSLRLWRRLRDRTDLTILSAVAEEFAAEGIEVVSPLRYLKDCLTPEGPITAPPEGRRPDERERADIAFGWRIGAALAGLEVGQSLIVKDKAVVAVEAMEGTDEAIRRGGGIAQSGAVLVKVSRPDQDPRFDIPCAGPETVRTCAKAGVGVIALEAGRTLLLEKDRMIAEANAARIALYGIGETERGRPDESR